jgi:hypothetical protein
MGDKPLAQQYPSLYHIVQHRNVLVADVLAQVPLNITFRRVLQGNKWTAWLHLCRRLMNVTLENEPDTFAWNLTTSELFIVKHMYEDLMTDHTPYLRKYLWKIKIPLKIKKFMWFLHNKVLLTNDNLAKRNWKGCTKCCFYGVHETIEHRFIACPFSKLLWRVVFFDFDLPPPANINNMFGNWLNGVDKKAKDRIHIGVSTLCWSI